MSNSGDEERETSADPPPEDGPRTAPGAGESSAEARTRRRWPMLAARALLVLACLVGVTAAMAGFGSRWGFWHFRTGFTLLEWSAYGALGVAVLTLPVLWLTRPGQGSRRPFALAVGALVVSVPVFLVPLGWRLRAGDVPPIHDITTDTNDPPRFDEIVALRAEAPNPVEYPGPDAAEQQREAYPDIRPAVLDISVGRAYERALAAARDMGWEIVSADLDEGRIEATDRTFWFGFTDDVVVRLTPSGDRTIVDVRSKSRVGRSDVGTNARRIRSYLERLTA
ncbi:MAG: DUF1499 domain-containing protein [Longimicrobiales bacterium]|nr:DUF1499 domain-containing protein [Longimicrobiales bacterium]